MADNTLLRHQPLTILQQLEELRNWHKEQQSKLNPSKSPVDIKSNKINNEKAKNLSDDIAADKIDNLDEIPIKVTNSNFNEMIEKNIKLNYALAGETQQDKGRPKFKFLKKGEGIARFGIGAQKAKKKALQNKFGLNLTKGKEKHNGSKIINDKITTLELEDSRTDKTLTLKPPDVKLSIKNFKNMFETGNVEEIIEKAIDNNQLELFEPNSSIDSSTASIMEKLIAVGRKHIRDKEELRVFETVEQHVLDSSFCSTSSYVTRLMENAVISTPKKISTSVCTPAASISQRHSSISGANKFPEVNTEMGKRMSQTIIWSKPENNKTPELLLEETNSSNIEHSLHVKFSEKVDYKSFVEHSRSFNSLDQLSMNDGQEFNDNEEWKDDSGRDSSCCSQCDTPYSSSDENVITNNPPVKISQEKEHQISTGKCTVSATENTAVEKINDQPDTKLISLNNEEALFPPILNKKLNELDDEIKIFREENRNIKKLKEILESEKANLQVKKKKIDEEKLSLLKELEEEKKKHLFQLEEEKQKLAKEKFIFEKYSKSVKKNPSKEERKEIQALREQLHELKEELNKKESRWGSAQARVRNQVKLLEEDNKKLKEEVEMLRKQAKYWELFHQKKKCKPFNNTKFIHAISKHISNINDEDHGSVNNVVEVGYLDDAIVMNQPNLKNVSSVQLDKTRQLCSVSSSRTNDPLADGQILKNNYVNHSDNEQINQDGINKRMIDTSGEEVPPKSLVAKTIENSNIEVIYPNGNIKKINPVTGSEKTIYFNGDVEEIFKNGTVKYYFSESRKWHTTFPDGLQIWDFPNGQVEKKHINGTIEIIFPNNNKKCIKPNGSEEIFYTDGTTLKVESDNTQVLTLPNGQKEIHTNEFKRREYPDGTVKTLYPDGSTQTVYSNGRVRLKDKHGNLISDSGDSSDLNL